MSLLGGLFGKPSLHEMTENEIARLSQQAAASYSAQMMANQGIGHGIAGAGQSHPAAQYNPNPVSYARTVSGVHPLEFKAQRAITTVVEQLSMRIAQSIYRIEFKVDDSKYPGPSPNSRYVVTFIDAKKLEFHNVETFPLDEDVARIALECP
jgi:hypothetical protein